MDRQLLGYLLLAALLGAAVLMVVRARYYSRENVVRRGRLADQARRADRALRDRDEARSAD